MICPYCKNETLNEPVCPSCGLSRDDALRQAAKEWQKRGNFQRAQALWKELLNRLPGDSEARRQLVVCRVREALAPGAGEGPEKAEKFLKDTLVENWEWEEGHQLFLEMGQRLKKLEQVKHFYEEQLKENHRAEKAHAMHEMIALIEKFHAEPPPVSADLPAEEGVLAFLQKPAAVFLGFPFILWGAARLFQKAYHQEKATGEWFWIFFGSCLSLGLWIGLLRKKRKKTP